MREIKFRAWDKERDRMILDVGFVSDSWFSKGTCILHKDMALIHKKDYFELMQFTGLKDKNKKKIYEGDILEDTGENKSKIMGEGIIRYLVKFEEGCFTLGNGIGLRNLTIYHNVLEVIGNIYENPELLNSDKVRKAREE